MLDMLKLEKCHFRGIGETSPLTNAEFNTIKEYDDNFNTNADHRERSLVSCKECGQLYFREWLEWIDWDNGNDPTYTKYVPVEDEATADELHKLSALELLDVKPRLERNYPDDAKHPTNIWLM